MNRTKTRNMSKQRGTLWWKVNKDLFITSALKHTTAKIIVWEAIG